MKRKPDSELTPEQLKKRNYNRRYRAARKKTGKRKQRVAIEIPLSDIPADKPKSRRRATGAIDPRTEILLELVRLAKKFLH